MNWIKSLIVYALCLIFIMLILVSTSAFSQDAEFLKETAGAVPEKVAGDFAFTEGVTSDAEGNIYFSDIPENKIYYWTTDGRGSVFLENSNYTNGLQVDEKGNIVACESRNERRLVSISPEGKVSVLAYGYNGKAFNSPNDLWIDQKGGIYVTDPRYGRSQDSLNQDGEHVYYLTPDRGKVTRVIDNMVKPNGVIGTPDGSTLYVADHGGGKTYKYTVLEDGTLTDRQLFANEGSDGMTIDSQGNVYLTTEAVKVYNPAGHLIETIHLPERPTNVCFGGQDHKTLFITARTSVYKLAMKVKGTGSN